MSTSTIIALLKEALSIIRNFNLSQKVVDSIATAESYLDGNNPDVLYALVKLEDAANSISTDDFNSNIYILGVQRTERIRLYNSLCLKISEIHSTLGHMDISMRWLERRIHIQRFIANTDMPGDEETWYEDSDPEY